MNKVPLLGLKADQFRHPLDLEATAAFKRLPGWDWALRAVFGPIAEQALYLENIGSWAVSGSRSAARAPSAADRGLPYSRLGPATAVCAAKSLFQMPIR